MSDRRVSVATAARILSTSRCTVLRLIAHGDLRARRRGLRGWYHVDRDSLDKFMERIRKSLEDK
ncbi:MAG: helix-turn-helix domain-containing protein [Acidobacteriia bacterium]|nr:helix-turn-helix domain-containing protein [Terriglobia bacterium]